MYIKRFKGKSILKFKRMRRLEIMELVIERVKTKKTISRPKNIISFTKPKDTFDEMMKAGEAFKKALGLSDGDVYKLLKR